ncbi:hypothetical protein N9N67_03670 [Bacteriovoracaceae bacterium]|nr:hypothetical protein [Bacteriovoracaceae bacterium]
MNILKGFFLLILILNPALRAEHTCLITLEDPTQESPLLHAQKIYTDNSDLLTGNNEFESFYSNRSLLIDLKITANGHDQQKELAHPYTEFEGNIKINSKGYHINLFRLTRESSKVILIPDSNLLLNFRCHDAVFDGYKQRNYLDFIGEYVPMRISKNCSSILLKASSDQNNSINFSFAQKSHKKKQYELSLDLNNQISDEGSRIVFKFSKSKNKVSWEKFKKRKSKTTLQLMEKHSFELRNLLLLNKKYHKDVLVHIRENRKGKKNKCYFQRY